MGLVFSWGGVAMLAIYTLSGIWWWHSWQYGLGMLFIGMGLWVFAALLDREGSTFRSQRVLNLTAWMAFAQGLAAVAGLVFLGLSGKIEAGRADWAANIIFLTGGSGIAVLSLLAAATYWRVSARLSS